GSTASGSVKAPAAARTLTSGTRLEFREVTGAGAEMGPLAERRSAGSQRSAVATLVSHDTVGLLRPPSTSQKWLRETPALSGTCVSRSPRALAAARTWATSRLWTSSFAPRATQGGNLSARLCSGVRHGGAANRNRPAGQCALHPPYAG